MTRVRDADPPAVQRLTVDDRHAGQRIDNFLAARLKGVPRSRIYRGLRQGEVRVNRGRIRQDYRLQVGDVVRVPPLRTAAAGSRHPPGEALKQRLAARVLHRDRWVVAIDKPAGVPVHGGSGVDHGVVEALRAAWPDEPYLELVHRLDRETSGCLLLARRRSALRRLHESLRERRVDKRYLLLVRGRWEGGAQRVRSALERNVLRGGERVVRADPAGKPATTWLRPLARGETASLLQARTRTGRTHQIRVHAADLGHPLAGDGRYGDRRFNRQLRAAGLRRLFLHASSIAFPDPGGGTDVRVTAPLDAELAGVLEALGLAAGP